MLVALCLSDSVALDTSRHETFFRRQVSVYARVRLRRVVLEITLYSAKANIGHVFVKSLSGYNSRLIDMRLANLFFLYFRYPMSSRVSQSIRTMLSTELIVLVVTSKDFRGQMESTHLSRTFSDQGVRLRLRKEQRTITGYVAPATAIDTAYAYKIQTRIRRLSTTINDIIDVLQHAAGRRTRPIIRI